MLFHVTGGLEPACTVDNGSGARTPPFPDGTTTITTGGRTWEGFAAFDTGDGTVTISCEDIAPWTRLRVGPALGAGFVVRILVTILAPVVLGLAGMVVLVVTAVLWFTRQPRSRATTGQHGSAPGPNRTFG